MSTEKSISVMGIDISMGKETKTTSIVEKTVISLVRVAKILWRNKKYFEDIDYINSFNKEVISTRTGILIKYHRLNKMLKIGSKLYGVFGESPATKTARSLVKMATILHGGKKAFSLNIDPNYMKNVGQNMLDFNDLVKKLVESESEGSSFFGRMGESISSLFGLDPISQIANRMVTLAKGYDAMAPALIKLSTAMKMFNVNSGAQLGGFTKSLISGLGIFFLIPLGIFFCIVSFVLVSFVCKLFFTSCVSFSLLVRFVFLTSSGFFTSCQSSIFLLKA
jgi:hypothetical protein